ncbi:zinc finger protein 1-like [Phlebotomus papatasi]|uniref:zinc finger protein 1-like n=1 Tax=Phlebotomus papatasi TaxID=29031 RepID=UPI0024839960|nr:zinc finger protein 1-like [Phlebotomus papatasi]
MLGNWQRWCRLCAKINSEDIDKTFKMELIKNELEIVNKYFMISFMPFEDIQSLICGECSDFLSKLEHFSERCTKVDQMFRELILKENISESDLQSIRFKYEVDNEEIKYSTFLPAIQNVEEIKQDILNPDSSSDPLETEITIPTVKKEIPEIENLPTVRKRGRPRKSKPQENLSKSEEISKSETDSEIIRNEDTRLRLDLDKQNTPENKRIRYKETPSECKICSKTYSRKYLLKVHIREQHSKEFPFGCTSCSKRFATKKKLKVHEISHLSDEEKYVHPCPHCGKKFGARENMNAHIRIIHIGHRTFICEECGKIFRKKCALVAHQITHSDNRTFQCSFCPKRFKDRLGLNTHEDTHDNTIYECPECGVKLNTKRTLRMHMVIHSDVKKYKCNYCGNEYKRARTLKDHLIIHTGQRPFQCPFCDKAFANSSNCLSHKRKAHPAELAAQEQSGEQSRTVIPEVPELQSRATEPISLMAIEKN